MRVLLSLTFKASKKEPLAELLERANAAFVGAGVVEPTVRFLLADAAAPPNVQGISLPRRVSAIDRVLKRWPEMAAFLAATTPGPLGHRVRTLSNIEQGATQVPFARLVEIARGVPRSFPFHMVRFVFSAPEFGLEPAALPPGLRPGTAPVVPGLMITDNWWVNGRERALTGHVLVEAAATSASLPRLPDAVAAVAAALGKFKTEQKVLPTQPIETAPPPIAGVVPFPARPMESQLTPEVAANIAAVIERHRANFASTVARARLPHDFPSVEVAIGARTTAVEPTGPKKPALQSAFKPLGYSVTGDTGTFTLRRKTSANLTVEVWLDVGTWSRKLSGGYRVIGLGFRAPHWLTLSRHDMQLRSYPILGAEHWQKMVENLAALVSEIDRSFPVEIEAAAGPSPAWFEPPAL